MKAIRRAYHRTDGKILKRKECDVRRRGGSTAVTVIRINGEALVVANVGDSRVVISEDGVARQLSVDHEPLKGQHEIESRGGFVTNVRGKQEFKTHTLSLSRAPSQHSGLVWLMQQCLYSDAARNLSKSFSVPKC